MTEASHGTVEVIDSKTLRQSVVGDIQILVSVFQKECESLASVQITMDAERKPYGKKSQQDI